MILLIIEKIMAKKARMTPEEIRRSYPLTPDVLANMRKLGKQEPDMTDPDNPDVVEMLAKGCYKSISKKQRVVVHFDPIVLSALRQKGKNWQVQLNDHLKTWLTQTATL